MNRLLADHPLATFLMGFLLVASVVFQITFALTVRHLQANICTVVRQSRVGNPILAKEWQVAAQGAADRAAGETGSRQATDLAQQAQDLRIAQVYAPSTGISFPGC